MDRGKLALCALALTCLIASPVSRAAEITVSAAISLKNAFADIGREFEKARGHKVVFNFGASGALLQQIARGAPVDVFASADLETMDRAEKQNLIAADTRQNFVANRLVLAVPAGSTLSISALSDLKRSEITHIGVGNPESVPVGRYTKAVLEGASLWEVLRPKFIYAQDVRQCLDYVARGEISGGFVYATDAAVAGPRVRVALEVPTERPILYPIAVVKGNGQDAAARRFVEFVRSDLARAILTRHGFWGI